MCQLFITVTKITDKSNQEEEGFILGSRVLRFRPRWTRPQLGARGEAACHSGRAWWRSPALFTAARQRGGPGRGRWADAPSQGSQGDPSCSHAHLPVTTWTVLQTGRVEQVTALTAHLSAFPR